MKAQLPEKRSMFSKLGGSQRKLSLRERRKQGSENFSLSVSTTSKKLMHPVQKLKQGDYDIDTEHLLVSSEGNFDDNLE